MFAEIQAFAKQLCAVLTGVGGGVSHKPEGLRTSSVNTK